jgi:hypothetical protein
MLLLKEREEKGREGKPYQPQHVPEQELRNITNTQGTNPSTLKIQVKIQVSNSIHLPPSIFPLKINLTGIRKS